MAFENVFAFVNGNARRFVEDDDFIVLKDNIQPSQGCGVLAVRWWNFFEGDVELNAISRRNEVVRFGSFAVKPNAVFAEELSYIADRKPFLKKILQLFGAFSSGDGDFLRHAHKIIRRAPHSSRVQ